MADIEINFDSTDYKELLKCGHHAFIIKDYSNAAAALGRATQLMAQEHGEEHDSLGEVYLHYARALLELSRNESEPLGDAIPHGDDDSDDSEEVNEEANDNTENETVEESDKTAETSETTPKEQKETVDEKKTVESNADKSAAEVTSTQKADEDKKETEDEQKDGESDKEKVTNGVSSQPSTSCEDGPSTSNGATEESTEENSEKDEPSDLQLAWEVLEVAKKIFTARGDSAKELLSQTLILLGEVSMESENFDEAVNDIKAGLEIQENLYEKTSRKLAETQYKLGMAHSTVSGFDDAIKLFEDSIATLGARIDLLKEKDDESNKKEIQEIEELIPEIKEKICDMKNVKNEVRFSIFYSY